MGGFGLVFVAPAAFAAVQHAVPIFGPAFAPSHGAATNGAGFFRQMLFVTFETRGFGHGLLQ